MSLFDCVHARVARGVHHRYRFDQVFRSISLSVDANKYWTLMEQTTQEKPSYIGARHRHILFGIQTKNE